MESSCFESHVHNSGIESAAYILLFERRKFCDIESSLLFPKPLSSTVENVLSVSLMRAGFRFASVEILGIHNADDLRLEEAMCAVANGLAKSLS